MSASRKTYRSLALVEAYWKALFDETGVPGRKQIDPRGLDTALADAFILERIGPGVGRFRVAGQQLNALMGMEVRGMPLSALIRPADRGAVERMIDAVCDRPALARLAVSATPEAGRPQLEGAMFLAPLRDESGRIDRVLGALQVRGEIGNAPRRLTITRAVAEPVLQDNAASQGAPVAGFAEPAAPFEAPGGTAPGRARPRLRLVADNE